MNKTKKIVALIFAFVFCITATMGATIAYFKDTDAKTNTFTSGNVEIEQNETDRDGNVFVDNQKLLPIVDDSKDADGYHTGGNYIDKIVTVTNTGTEDAYIRTHIAFPAVLDDGDPTFDAGENILHWNAASANYTFNVANRGGTIENDWYWTASTAKDWPSGAEWNCYQTTVDEVLYNVYVATHGSAVAAGETTAPTLFGVYLDAGVDCDVTKDAEGNDVVTYYDKNGDVIDFDLNSTKILVVSEAVQVAGFEKYNDQDNVAFYALDKAFGAVGTYCPFGGTVVNK